MALYRHYGLTFYQLLSAMSILPPHFCEIFSVDSRCVPGMQRFLYSKLDMNFDYLFRSSYMPV